jgi:N-acetylglutamate synthase-like GNAT family acetyltransferase
MGAIRRCTSADLAAILAIVNDAAQAYRGHIPADRWHEPYMPAEELEHELAAGVVFWGWEEAGALAGVMGLQDVRDVALIRHAYVATAVRNRGIGGRLLEHVVAQTARPVLVGTWAAATWAIRFYERHGFEAVSPAEKERLLRAYWTIPDRQIETSVVLVDARWRRLRASPDPRPEDPS